MWKRLKAKSQSICFIQQQILRLWKYSIQVKSTSWRRYASIPDKLVVSYSSADIFLWPIPENEMIKDKFYENKTKKLIKVNGNIK